MTAKTRVAVVGAGPAGIAVAGALSARASLCVQWVDPKFNVGALSTYRSVPANTKVDVLIPSFGGFLPQGLPNDQIERALARMIHESEHLQANPDPAPLGWTTLGACKDVMQTMTAALMARPNVDTCHGWATTIERGSDHAWSVVFSSLMGSRLTKVQTDAVVLAPGGVAIEAPADLQPEKWMSRKQHLRVLEVDSALQLDQLPELIDKDETVGVVGGGHSGGVLVQYLHEVMSVETRWFIRSPIRLAQWDEDAGAYGSWGYRGLKGTQCRLVPVASSHRSLRSLCRWYPKATLASCASTALLLRLRSKSLCAGVAADFAIRLELAGAAAPNTPVASRLELHDVARLVHDPGISSDLDVVIFCLGFRRALLPNILIAGEGVTSEIAEVLHHRSTDGALLGADNTAIDGLYGLGLAFSDDEFSSGEAYGQVGFKPFALRAHEIAEAIQSRQSPADLAR